MRNLKIPEKSRAPADCVSVCVCIDALYVTRVASIVYVYVARCRLHAPIKCYYFFYIAKDVRDRVIDDRENEFFGFVIARLIRIRKNIVYMAAGLISIARREIKVTVNIELILYLSLIFNLLSWNIKKCFHAICVYFL